MARCGSLKAVSLFSGLGGLDIGLHRAGIETLVTVEGDPVAASTLKANSRRHPEYNPDTGLPSGIFPWRVIESDIREVSGDAILERADADESDIDLVVGGPPCQTFSRSNEGERVGTDNDRGRLFEEFARVVQDIEPAAFIFENVPGLLSSNGGDDLDQILATLSGERYISTGPRSGSSKMYGVAYDVLNAADFGVPQARKRLFILGVRSGEAPEPSTPDQRYETITAGQALSDLTIDSSIEEAGGYENAVGGQYGHLLQSIPKGANYQHFSERKYENGEYVDRTGNELKDKVFDWRSRHWNYLLKQDPRRPAWTIQAKPGTYVGPFHWQARRLSLVEQMRLQDLPLDYYVAGDHRAIQRQIGNVVPPGLAAAVARTLLTSQGLVKEPIPIDQGAKVELADGGHSYTESIKTRISGSISPWSTVTDILPALKKGENVRISGQGRRVAAAIDVAQIADRATDQSLRFSVTEEVIAPEERKSDELSDVTVLIQPV